MLKSWGVIKGGWVSLGKENSRDNIKESLDVLQDAINLTAMDKRQFAPPIEGSGYERVIYMANTCETFKIHPKTTARLIKYGYKSITLLSMAEGNFEVCKI